MVVNGPRLVLRDVIGVFSCVGKTFSKASYLGQAFTILGGMQEGRRKTTIKRETLAQ